MTEAEKRAYIEGAAKAAAGAIAGKRRPQREQAIGAMHRAIKSRGVSRDDFIGAIEAVEKKRAGRKKAA